MGFTLAGRASAPFSLRVLFAGITTLALVGCAGTTVRDVSDQTPDTTENEADQDARGIRYYERAPFILVHSDGKGGLVSELLFIEDTTRKRAIRPYAVLSQNK